MSEERSPLRQARELLGFRPWNVPPELDSPWRLAVANVLHHGRKSALADLDWSWLTETVLASPEETQAASLTALVDALEQHQFANERASSLQKLARWWGPSGGASPFETASLEEEARGELRKATGLSLEVLDQLLLLVGRRRAFPISRGIQRIACRHGWMDPQGEYADWQALFTRVADDPAELASLWQDLSGTAADFCGPKPKCDGCPLAPLLPERGPQVFES
jgi:endonuclease-3 related protein